MAPHGRFGWRKRWSDAHASLVLLEELKAKAADWDLLSSGLFASAERYLLPSFRILTHEDPIIGHPGLSHQQSGCQLCAIEFE